MIIKNWYLYVLECSDKSLYCGITTDLNRRLFEHNNDNKKGAKYTKSRRPVIMIFSTIYNNRSEASKSEIAFKKLKRNEKFNWIEKMNKMNE